MNYHELIRKEIDTLEREAAIRRAQLEVIALIAGEGVPSRLVTTYNALWQESLRHALSQISRLQKQLDKEDESNG